MHEDICSLERLVDLDLPDGWTETFFSLGTAWGLIRRYSGLSRP